MQPNERTIAYRGRGYSGYYRRCDNVQLLSNINEVAVRFDLKMNFTAFRVGVVTYLLISETSDYITTEDGLTIEIG